MVTFTFEGVEYEIDGDDAGRASEEALDIRLPDGRIVRPHGWLESCPPIPTDLTLVPVAAIQATKK